MKEREILFENRYEVDRELYDRWRRLGLVQSRGALFFRFVWAGLLVLVTADHGLLDCECRYTCDYPELEQALTPPFHIEARAAGFYVKPEYRKVFPQLFDAAFGHDDFWLVSTDAALSMGLLGGGTPRADIREIIGDYMAIASSRYSLEHSRVDTALTAMHAGMTAREMYVPLIVAKT